MAKLHPLVFLITGLIVVVISYFNENLLFFKYIGGVLILYGTAKIVFKLITGKEKIKDSADGLYGDKKWQQQMREQGKIKQKHQAPAISRYTCPRCRAEVFFGNNFCGNCGMRLR